MAESNKVSAVDLRGVSAGYGDTVVLEDVNLALQPGESISIIGRNGVGKTTLLSTIMGHTTLHKGEVLLSGRSLNGVPVYRRAAAGIGFVPQEREIFPSLSVLENLEVGARPGHWIKERVFELFPNLKERLDNRGNQLSGGEQQMLSIARALLTNPSVLLMDEPTEGLAPVVVETLTAVLIKLRSESGLSIILVEQNSRVAFEFSERSVVLDKGRIVYDGASAALRDDPERLQGDRRFGVVAAPAAHTLSPAHKAGHPRHNNRSAEERHDHRPPPPAANRSACRYAAGYGQNDLRPILSGKARTHPGRLPGQRPEQHSCGSRRRMAVGQARA